MKVGILKLGGNITWSSNVLTAGNVDIHTVCRALVQHCEIHIITGKTRNTKIPRPGIFHNILTCDINNLGLDALLVFNGNVNFFGGKESKEGIMNYIHINKFEGPVYIMNTDGQLAFKQLWPAIAPKEWAPRWKEEDIVVTRNDIIYITQGRDIVKTAKEYGRQKGFIKPQQYRYFPLEAGILMKPPTILRSVDKVKYDLIYGGKVRSTGRRKDLVNFYVNGTQGLDVHLFGGLNPKQLHQNKENMPHVTFGSKVTNRQFVSKMATGRATVIVGDPFYHNNFFTLRMFESLLAGTLLLIDHKMDVKREFFGTDDYFEPFYVRDGESVGRLLHAMNSYSIEKAVQDQQRRVIEGFDPEMYSQKLFNLISV